MNVTHTLLVDWLDIWFKHSLFPKKMARHLQKTREKDE